MTAPPPEAPGWPDWVELWILPYLGESVLWPVLFAFVGHVVAVLALSMLSAVRDQTLVGILGMVLLVAVSAAPIQFEWRCTRRFGGLTALVIVTWVVSALAAWGAAHTGLL